MIDFIDSRYDEDDIELAQMEPEIYMEFMFSTTVATDTAGLKRIREYASLCTPDIKLKVLAFLDKFSDSHVVVCTDRRLRSCGLGISTEHLLAVNAESMHFRTLGELCDLIATLPETYVYLDTVAEQVAVAGRVKAILNAEGSADLSTRKMHFDSFWSPPENK